jgi:uncharacterized membrane protein YeaQ/YmgE (transglycosylase-associated protein family)
MRIKEMREFNIGGIVGAIIYSVIGAVILLLIVPFFKP